MEPCTQKACKNDFKKTNYGFGLTAFFNQNF